MSQPQPYNRQFSFANYQAEHPSDSLPGGSLDAELNAVKATSDAINANLKLIQRDDGAVANASVGLDQLKAEVTVGFQVPVVWVTATSFATSNTVFHGSAFYRCLVAHTSGVFATDLAALKWQLIVDLSTIATVSAAQVAVTPSGNLTTDVQGSLVALDAAKAATSHTHPSSAISDSTADGRALLTATLAAQKTLLGLNAIAVTAITAQIALTGEIVPPVLLTNTNDWAPANWATSSVVKLSASTPVNLTGLTATTNGDIKVLVNNVASGSDITLTSRDAASAAANRILLSRPMVLRPGQSVTLEYDSTSAEIGWRILSTMSAHPPAGGLKNLICGNVAGPQSFTAPTTPNSQYKITADSAVMEDANGETWLARTVSVTADITATGANGFDGTGSLASAPLFGWIIGNATTNTIAAMMSRSATAPTMPSGYTFKMRVGGTFADPSSHLSRTLQQGRRGKYVLVAGSNTTAYPLYTFAASQTATSLAVSSAVPATASAFGGVVWVNLPSTQSTAWALGANANYGANSSSTNPPPIGRNYNNGGSGNDYFSMPFWLEFETAQTVYYSTSSLGAWVLVVVDWEENI